MSDNKLQEIYAEYWSDYSRKESIEAEFCEEAKALLESEGLDSETYEVQICWLHEYCGQNIKAGLVAQAVGCSIQYARRFSYDDERGAFQKEWSKSTQNEKVSPGARTKIIRRDGGACLRCGLEDENELEVHHILPVNQGGKNDDSNLATLCSHCHKAAHGGSKTSGETVYAKGDFRKWVQRTNRVLEEQNLSINSIQTRISEY